MKLKWTLLGMLVLLCTLLIARIGLEVFESRMRAAEYKRMIGEVTKIRECIENYRKTHHQYPESLGQIEAALKNALRMSSSEFTNDFIYLKPSEADPDLSTPLLIERLGRYRYLGNYAHAMSVDHAVLAFDENFGTYTEYLKKWNIPVSLVKPKK